MSTASQHCRNRVQRLQPKGFNAPHGSGSRGRDPGVLRPQRPSGQSNSSGQQKSTRPRCRVGTPCDLEHCQRKPKAKIPAFFLQKAADGPLGQGCAVASRQTHRHTIPCSNRLEAKAGTSPPFFTSTPPP